MTTIFTDKVYDRLKWVALVLLPGLATLWFALAQVWGLAYAEQILGTLVALDTFLGVLLGISTKQYNNSDQQFDGAMRVETGEDGRKLFSLELDSDPEEIQGKDVISFKVVSDD